MAELAHLAAVWRNALNTELDIKHHAGTSYGGRALRKDRYWYRLLQHSLREWVMAGWCICPRQSAGHPKLRDRAAPEHRDGRKPLQRQPGQLLECHAVLLRGHGLPLGRHCEGSLPE